MNKAEEYEIVKTDSDEPIKLDGKYFKDVKEKLLAKFRKQPDPERRVQMIVDNAIDTFKKIRHLQSLPTGQRNLLMVGKVQSGKTSNMQAALALAFDNGYNSAIIYGGYDSVLLDQAINRFKDEAFKKPNWMSDDAAKTEWVNIISTRKDDPYCLESLDEDGIDEILEDGGKLIFICMKKSTGKGSKKPPQHIDKLNEFFKTIDVEKLKPIIFDDEGDQASLNNEYRANDMSSTYSAIVDMKDILHNPPYLSVTATPQALVFQYDTSKLDPKDLKLIHPGEGYTGLNYFHSGDAINIVTISDDMEDALTVNKLPSSLWDAFYSYVITSAILKKKGVMDRTQMIIHFDEHTSKHNEVYDKLDTYLKQFQDNIKNAQITTIERKLKLFEKVFDDENLITDEVKGKLSFDDIKDEILYVLRKAYVALQNGPGKETMLKLERKRYQIRIGAALLQRGVSFDYLITTYFTRWPKNSTNMDTQIQRARWLGYRTSYFPYCQVFTTDTIAQTFADMRNVEDDMWSQMSEVEAGQKKISDILVLAPESTKTKIRPSRRSASDYEIRIFGHKWHNQAYAIADNRMIEDNNNAFNELYLKHEEELEPTTAGSNVGETTAWHCEISFDDFIQFLTKTDNIFDRNPFGDIDQIVKAAKTHKVDLVVFWDPRNVDVKEKRFLKDTRSRKFTLNDEGYRVTNLHEGERPKDKEIKTYLGDDEVITDQDALTVQVFPIWCKAKTEKENDINGKFQYMYSLRFPTAVAMFSRSKK